jgi:Rrf2 family transcriptional repressor of oqxAB
MLDALGRRNIADSLAELLRLDAIRMKRLTITANAAE